MATPFRPALDLLSQYAEYHRDPRNIRTHLVGVPLIVFAVGMLLSRPAVEVAGWLLTPAWVVFALTAAWYLTRGHLGIGLTVTVQMGVLIGLAHTVGGSTGAVLGWGIGLFVLGWVIQFIGHHYEGRKPAFADDLVGLLVGPMFVALELATPFGGFKSLNAAIEQRAGPVRHRTGPLARGA